MEDKFFLTVRTDIVACLKGYVTGRGDSGENGVANLPKFRLLCSTGDAKNRTAMISLDKKIVKGIQTD